MKKIVISIIICLVTFLVIVPFSFAGEAQEAPELTLNQAIERAIKYNEAIKKAEVEIERTEALRDEASDQLNFIPAGGVSYTPQMQATWASILRADLTWRMNKKEKDAKVDGLALDVCEAYWDVLNGIKKVNLKKISVEKARVDYRNALVKYDVGMVAKVSMTGNSGLKQTKAALEKAKTELASARNDLNNSYVKFNQLIGMQIDKRPILTQDVEFHPIEISNLNTETSRALERSPAIWKAEQSVNLQKYYQDLLWATGEYRPYDAREAERQKAHLDVINAKEATKLLVRDLYYQIMNIEEQYKSAKAGSEVAKESLRVAKIMNELGMATKEDVLKAKVALSESEITLSTLAAKHAYLKLAFQKPWAPSYSTVSSY